MNRMIKAGLVIGTASALLSLSACHASTPTASGPAPSVPGTTPSPSTPSPSPSTAGPSATAAPTPVASPPDPCPVSDTTLVKAIQGTDVGSRGGNPKHFVRIWCYHGYAVGREEPQPATDSAYFLFGYKRPENRWIPLNLGSAGICDGYVLDSDVRNHLGACAG
jgi:hypothetical protein